MPHILVAMVPLVSKQSKWPCHDSMKVKCNLSFVFPPLVDIYADLKRTDQDRTSSHFTTSSSQRTNSVMNINDLPLPTDLSETTIFQSAVFIEDGVHYRSIHHSIDPTPLKLYRIYYHKYVRWCLGLFIFINLILAFFEYPTSLTLSSDSRFRDRLWHMTELHCGVTESIEILCLLVFLLDCSFKFYLIGWKRFVRKPWLVLYAVMLVLSFVDLFMSLIFCIAGYKHSLLYTLRLRRFCRPLFFLLSSTIMKKFAKAVVLTLPQIFSVLVLLVLHLYIFAMIGLLVFPRSPYLSNSNQTNSSNVSSNASVDPMDINGSQIHPYSYYAELEGSEYFSSVSQAFVSLLVLLTTANHPDVMIPIYQYNRFSSIYFVLFLGIGTFLILNLLIAATYNQFKGFFQKSLQSSFLRRRVAFRAAFTLLARKTSELQQERGSRLSYVQEVASKDLIRRLLQKARIPGKQLPQMYPKLETIPSHCLNWHQFREIFDLVSKEPTQKHQGRLLFYGKWRWLQWIQFAVRHRFFYYFTYAISVVNVILITIELEVSYDNSLKRADSRLAYYNLVFVVYYILEQVLKLIGHGFRGYFRSYGNIYEGILTLVLVFLEILVLAFSSEATTQLHENSAVVHYDMVIRIMNIIIVLRLLRIVAHVKSLRILISIIIDLFKNLSGFAGLMIITYYLFALLGMELFVDVDGPSQKEESGDKSWSDTCGTYDNLNYYANNFHDFASSLMTLWDVMVVNNWFVFLDKFARDSMLSGWSRLYFIVWWLIAAIMGMNLFVSLVLDTFVIKWEAVHGRRLRQEDEGVQDGDLDRFSGSNNWEASSSSAENLVSYVKYAIVCEFRVTQYTTSTNSGYYRHSL